MARSLPGVSMSHHQANTRVDLITAPALHLAQAGICTEDILIQVFFNIFSVVELVGLYVLQRAIAMVPIFYI